MRRLACAIALVATACGASEERGDPGPAATEEPPAATAEATPEPENDEAPAPEPEPPAEPPPPPAPPPIEVEAGVRMGPIRIGMTADELAALGLETTEVDPRSQRYGPYRVWVERGAVTRVEATMGDLGRIRFGDREFEAGVDIYALRDAFPGCVWEEGGGERYRCADGRLTVVTTHTMNPLRYTLGVRSR